MAQYITDAVNLHTNTLYIAMTKICFFVNLLLILCLSASAQRTDSSAIKGVKLYDSIKNLPSRLPPNFYSLNLGFFCRKDLQVENAIKVPLHFRLGSVAYCDALEGKNNSHP
jgi:hypothetical protein